MNLIDLQAESIALGQPLPFTLRGEDGVLLAHKGYTVQSRQELDAMRERGRRLCVDTDESGESYRAWRMHLQRALLDNQSLGSIAAVQITGGLEMAKPPPPAAHQGRPDWPELQTRATHLLRAPRVADFAARFHALHQELARHSTQSPDAAVLALIHLASHETDMYSATHAMLVACVTMLVARQTLRWPEPDVQCLGRAALSMNIASTALQDQLARQTQPLSAAQYAEIEAHGEQSEALLRALGVSDAHWLDAVRLHHQRAPGALAQKPLAAQMARLIQRADIFAARISPRVTRAPMPVTSAMQASYYDETMQVDEAGSALVKTLGIYPPGALVRLASQEVAVVLRRGPRANMPHVAVVLNRQGMPTGEMIPRDTSQPVWKVTGPALHKDVRVHLPLGRLLALAGG